MANVIQIIIQGEDKASPILKGVGTAALGLGAAAVGLAAGFGIAAKAGLDQIMAHERLTSSLENLAAREFVATGKADDMAEALSAVTPVAEELTGWVEKVGILSPFTSEGIGLAFKTAMAYGFAMEETKRLTQAEVDFASAMGSGVEATNSISLALGQMKSKGKVSGQELMQLTNAGIGVSAILEKMGFTLDDVSKGLVPVDDMIEAVIQDMELFGGAAERQSTSWSGLMSSLGEIKDIGLREFFTGFFTAIQPYTATFITKLQEALPTIREWGDRLGAWVSIALPKLIDFVSIWGPKAVAFFTDIYTKVNEALPGLREFAGILGDTISNLPTMDKAELARQFWSWTVEAATGINEKMDTLLDAFVAWSESPEAQTAFTTAGDSLGKVLLSAIGAAFTPNKDIMETGIAQGIIEMGLTRTGKVFDALTNLGTAFADGLIGSFIRSAEAKFGIQETWSPFMRGFVKGFSDTFKLFGVMVFGPALGIPAFMGNLFSAFRDAINKGWPELINIGRDICEGFRAGIIIYSWKIQNAVRDAINEALRAAREALGIGSPSKMFANIGQFAMQGLAMGVTGAANLPANAAERAVRNMYNTTNNYLTMNVQTQATSSTVISGFNTMRALV